MLKEGVKLTFRIMLRNRKKRQRKKSDQGVIPRGPQKIYSFNWRDENAIVHHRLFFHFINTCRPWFVFMMYFKIFLKVILPQNKDPESE